MEAIAAAERATMAVVVEDDPDIRRLVQFQLESAGFDVTACTTIRAARAFVSAYEVPPAPIVFVLDRMLEDGDGASFCEQLRADARPRFQRAGILILTAKNAEDDRLRGFEAGADDYLGKPFSVRELIARVQVLASVTKAREVAAARDGVVVLSWRGLMLDVVHETVMIDGRRIALRPIELRILKLLLESTGRTFARSELLSKLWASDEAPPSMRSIDTQISRLRDALGSYASMIETIHGEGYRIRSDVP